MLAIHVIGSGSKGNCAIIEDCETGHGLMIDCGICKRDVFGRAEEAGFDISLLDAILITHDHSDHTKSLGVVLRGFKCDDMELFVLPSVLEASKNVKDAKQYATVSMMECGSLFNAAGIDVFPFATSHDAAGSCGFRFSSEDGDAIGYMTDTGTVTEEASHALANVRILALESNHDEKMLKEGPYPYILKKRIFSDAGHLSNSQAAEFLSLMATPRLEHVIAMHLSENNNLPSLAKEALERALISVESDADVTVASQRSLRSIR